MDEIDLRNEIIRLKKRITTYKEENQLLKVKIRKLTTQIVKKDKDIEILLNPAQIASFRKVFSERSVSIISQMREKNEELEKLLADKDVVIKKLQDSLKVAKCYTIPELHKKRNKRNSKTDLRTEKLKLILNIQDEENSEGFSPVEPETLIEISGKDHLKVEDTNRLKNCSPESDLERTELFYSGGGDKHEEIQYLQDNFLDLISEVGVLKNTIKKLQNEQCNTKQVLEKKENNIEKLTEEIENLKIVKSNRSGSYKNIKYTKKEKQDILRRIYSAKDEKRKQPKIIIIKEISARLKDVDTETDDNTLNKKESILGEADECETY